MSLNEAYDVLERYYLVIYDISDANYKDYDVDVAYTKGIHYVCFYDKII